MKDVKYVDLLEHAKSDLFAGLDEIAVVNIETDEYRLLKSPYYNDVVGSFSEIVKNFMDTKVLEIDYVRYKEFMNTDYWQERASRSHKNEFAGRFRFTTRSGDEKWSEIIAVQNQENTSLYTVAFRVLNNATEEDMLNAWYIRDYNPQVEVDELTNLLNRRGFDAKLEEYLNEPKNDKGVLIAIDIDNFKLINDVFGHAVGDEALVVMSNKMREVFNEKSIIGRNGGR